MDRYAIEINIYLQNVFLTRYQRTYGHDEQQGGTPVFLSVSILNRAFRIDRFAGLSNRIPRWTGTVLAVFGLWSIYFGLFVNLVDWV